MPRVAKIRWRDKDVKELQRLVKNFNAKISRVQRKDPSKAEFLPDKVSVKGLMETITTRAEFKRQKSTFSRFAERGSEQLITAPAGFELTKFAFKEAKEQTRILNIIKAKERKRLGITVEKGVTTSIRDLGLLPKRFTLGESRTAFEKLEESLTRQLSVKRDLQDLENYKENYLKGLKQIAGNTEELEKLIEGLSAQSVFDISVQNPFLVIKFHYDDEFGADTRIEAMQREWELELA